MARRLPPLNALRAFEAAARCGSFTKAADELCVTPGAISRQVQVLERHLGVALFTRKNREVIISADGQRYREMLTAVFDQINTATYDLRTKKKLHISSYMTFSMRWLMPRFPSFRRDNPEYSIVFTTTPANIFDVSSGTIDVAILSGFGDWHGVVAHRLFSLELMPVCSPRYRDAMRLECPDDLSRASLLHSLLRPNDWANWIESVGATTVDASTGAKFESSVLAYEAAINDMGIAIGLKALVVNDLVTGRLVCPFNHAYQDGSAYYLVYSSKLIEDKRVKRFRKWILKEAAEFSEWLRQREPAHGEPFAGVAQSEKDDAPLGRLH